MDNKYMIIMSISKNNIDSVDQNVTNKWLETPEIFAETKGFMKAMSDRIIKKKYYQNIPKLPEIPDDC